MQIAHDNGINNVNKLPDPVGQNKRVDIEMVENWSLK